MIISKSCNSKNINLRSMIVYFATSVKFIVTARAMANCEDVKFAVLFCVDPTSATVHQI